MSESELMKLRYPWQTPRSSKPQTYWVQICREEQQRKYDDDVEYRLAEYFPRYQWQRHQQTHSAQCL